MRSISFPSRIMAWVQKPLPVAHTTVCLLVMGATATASLLPPRTRHHALAPLEALTRSLHIVTTPPSPVSPASEKVNRRAQFQLTDYSTRAVTFTVTSDGDAADAQSGVAGCQTSSADGGNCTLRAAIQESNRSNGATIRFNIPGTGIKTIKLKSPLPFITRPVLINGYSQPGSLANTLAKGDNAKILIQIDASGQGNKLSDGTPAGDGFNLLAGSDGSTIYGVAVGGVPLGSGIVISNSNHNTIKGCFIGVAASGTTAFANQANGVFIGNSSSNNLVGGPTLDARNVISGNGVASQPEDDFPAIFIEENADGIVGAVGAVPKTVADYNTVQNNFIGLDASGTKAIANGGGVDVNSESSDPALLSNTRILDNFIAGNNREGVGVSGSKTANTVVQGNKIGLTVAGTTALPNASDGMFVTNGATGTKVGGIGSGLGNVLSGNQGSGLLVLDSVVTVQGNYIGTDSTGTKAVGNSSGGIFIYNSSGNVIGGSTKGAGNVISGNSLDGIEFYKVTNSTIQGNYIGVDVNGTKALGNETVGISLRSTSGDLIGGTTRSAGNVISGNGATNGYSGILINSPTAGSSDTSPTETVQGNYIGVDTTGTAIIPNNGPGILLNAADHVVIGGTASGAGNLIGGNKYSGILGKTSNYTQIQNNFIGTDESGRALGNTGAGIVFYDDGFYNKFTGNSLANNGGLGIDLSASYFFGDGVTPNQQPQKGGGTNNLQNFPVIASVQNNTIKASLSSFPTKTFTIDFYSSPQPDASGYGEGQTYLGSKTVSTDASGNTGFFTLTLPLPSSGVITATATGIYGTSEFSQAVVIATPTPTPKATATPKPNTTPTPTGTPTATPQGGDGYAWGDNSHGELGDGTTDQSSSPVAVYSGSSAGRGILGGKKVVQVAAGAYFTLALCGDGTVAAWGTNSDGELGNGSSSTRSIIPVAVTANGVLKGKKVVQIAAGTTHCLALCSDGTVAAWGGSGQFGELGNGSNAASKIPVLVSTNGALAGKKVVQITTGGSHSLALCNDGTVVAWGLNDNGQLGNSDNTYANSNVPVPVDATGVLNGKTVVQLAATGYSSAALCRDGTIVTWGQNNEDFFGDITNYGTLGDGTFNSSNVPVAVSTSGVLKGKKVVQLAGGGFHYLALCGDSTLVAWGYNADGELGNGSYSLSNIPVLVNTSGVLKGKTVVQIAAGRQHSLVLCRGGTLATWGSNQLFQLGNGTKTTSNFPVLVDASGVLKGHTPTQLIKNGNEAFHSTVITASVPTPTATPKPTSTATPRPTATPLPSLSINDVATTEGNNGTKAVKFTVTISGANNHAVTAHYATSDGTAKSGNDYTATSGTLTFGASSTTGPRTQLISVAVTGDTIREANETFFVTLSGASGARITRPKGTGTIQNDDLVADLSVGQSASASSVTPNTVVVFTLTIKNNGPDRLASATLTNTFSSASFVSSSPSPTTQSTGKVTFALGAMTSGASKKVTVQMRAAGSAGTLSNRAAVAGSGASDSSSSNNSANTTVQITGG